MKKNFIFIISLFLIVISIGIFSTSFGNETIALETNQQSTYLLGTVTTDSLRVRSGLSTDNSYIGILNKNDTVYIYGKENDWYIIKTENNLVGAVFAEYIETSYDEYEYENEETIQTSSNIENADTILSTLLSQDEQIFFNLINNKRIENNLPEFQIDEKLLNVARLKAQDIEKNKYFSHTSPTYGTLFEMLQNYNISYSKASENICRNVNADSAIKSFMKSETHKNNILSQDYNYTGIGVVNSVNYGKIFVEIFVAK